MRLSTSRGALAALALSFGAVLAANEKPQAEILHWWSSHGESAALEVIINAYEERGGHYFDSTKDNQTESRAEAIERMRKGYPSTLTQWNAGRDIREFYDYGVTNAITDPKLIVKLEKSLPKPILDAVTHDGNIIAMPVNIHGENWMWYSNELIDYSNSMLSSDMQNFLDLGDELAQENIPLLAVGDQAWQVRILFTSLFLAISRDTYKDFYLKPVASADAVETAAFARLLKVFNRLATQSESFGDGNWNTQIKAVADNEAGAAFMGDWAKGEFQSLGKSAGKEYGCALTAGDDPSLLLVIDAFILGKVTDPAEKAGQSLMLDVISDPQINQQFNELKGSVSPFIIAADATPDACSAQVYETLAKNDSVIPPYASHGHGRFMHSIDHEIYRFWKESQDSNADPAELINVSLNNFRVLMASVRDRETELANINE